LQGGEGSNAYDYSKPIDLTMCRKKDLDSEPDGQIENHPDDRGGDGREGRGQFFISPEFFYVGGRRPVFYSP